MCMYRCKQHHTNKMLVSESSMCVWKTTAIYSHCQWINLTAEDCKLFPFKAGFPPCPHPHILPPEWPLILKAAMFTLPREFPTRFQVWHRIQKTTGVGTITYSLSSDFSPRICLWVSSQQENSKTANRTPRNTNIYVIRKSFPPQDLYNIAHVHVVMLGSISLARILRELRTSHIVLQSGYNFR